MSIANVIATQDFVYAPSTSQPRKINLESDQTVIDSTGVAKKWQYISGAMPSIVFYDESGSFVARMQWNGKLFQGYDKTGPAELRPSRPDEFKQAFVVRRPVSLHGETAAPTVVKSRIDFEYPIEPLADPSTTAIVLIGCNRMGYFQQVVDALAPQVTDKPVYLFLDRPIEEGQVGLMAKQEDYAKSKFGSLRVIKRPVNWGCGLNIIDAREKVLNTLGHERAFIFEDDMVPDSNYIEFCEKLWDWSRQFSNVGIVQGWSHCLLSPNQKKVKNKDVFTTFENAWGYLISKDCWRSIRTLMLDYTTFIREVPYMKRDNLRITRFMRLYKDRPFEPHGTNPVTLDQLSIDQERYFLDNCPTGQDGMTYLALRNAGLVRLAPVVNRAIYIGKTGLHSTPAMYDKAKLGNVTHSNISVPDSFKLRNK